ncbi:MAG TPA: murein L,D-transpeptidase catalytic domain family protein [Xanthomonadaceae bacterium]|nr:murein L,D-transpeptidase catalytic domain family protein [Xanthomonadaceae bacterium]
MASRIHRSALAFLLLSSAAAAAPATAPVAPLHAPGLDANVLSLAMAAGDCAERRGLVGPARRLAVIDYSLPSKQPRMWVFDLAQRQLLYTELVAHGRGSGEARATLFSNDDGSYRSSLGLFSTAETYVGGNGYSLRMDGLEPGFNDRARERAIVMHGAWYVDPALASRTGRLGRSQGCPAVRPQVAHQLIDTLKGGQLVFAYYPDADWLRHSTLLHCSAPASRGGSGLGQP